MLPQLRRYDRSFILVPIFTRLSVRQARKNAEKYRSRDLGSMEVALACCTNEDCDTTWEVGDFIIDENDRFVDCKYN